jgi:uncharacterized membrane protein
MPSYVSAALLSALHELFTAAWIGGMIGLGMAALPAVRATLGAGAPQQRLAYAIFRRLQWVAKVSIVGLLVTGYLIAKRSPEWLGLFSTANLYTTVVTIKHVVVLLMLAAVAARGTLMQRIGPDRAPRPNEAAWLSRLLWANILLGVVVLALSGLNGALGAACVLPR